MLPVIAIVGRPNVGKSTLFNCLTKTRDAIVADQPGLTRDRKYGQGLWDETAYIVVDTGGLGEEVNAVDKLMAAQALAAVQEADMVLFVVDARAGLTAGDREIAQQMRRQQKKVQLVINKIDGVDSATAVAEFYELGFAEPIAIAASHRRGVSGLMAKVVTQLPQVEEVLSSEHQGIKVAFVGRPNVGKSTLINRILGEERVVVYDQPGTTRDTIYVPFERRGQNYILIDTAGIRRRGRVTEKVEKFSIVKALQAIEAANVVVAVFDAQNNIVEQDLRLLSFVIDAGKGLVIAVNKWDNMSAEQRVQVTKEMDRRLSFVNFAKTHFISALHGSGVGNIFSSIKQAYGSATKKLVTGQLNQILQKILKAHEPPLVKGHRIKLRYVHAGGSNPPLIIIHGNRVKQLPLTYRRYLINAFRNSLKLVGTPIRVEFKEGENPYKDKKNVLTQRQQKKRRRLIKHVK